MMSSVVRLLPQAWPWNATLNLKCANCIRSKLTDLHHMKINVQTIQNAVNIKSIHSRTFCRPNNVTERCLNGQNRSIEYNFTSNANIKFISTTSNCLFASEDDKSKSPITQETASKESTNTIKSNDTVIKAANTSSVEAESQPPQRIGILKRFKDAYKQYGKVLIGVHVATSIVWYGGFFYAAKSGIDVVPLLKHLGASDRIIQPFVQSGAGNFAVAYLLYKLATPARYTVTIGGTQLTVQQLYKFGYMSPPSPEDSFKNLMKAGRTQMKDKLDDMKDEMKDNVKERVDGMKDNVKGRVDGMKGNVKGRVDGMKDNVKGRVDGMKDNVKGRVDGMKDNVKGKVDGMVKGSSSSPLKNNQKQ